MVGCWASNSDALSCHHSNTTYVLLYSAPQFGVCGYLMGRNPLPNMSTYVELMKKLGGNLSGWNSWAYSPPVITVHWILNLYRYWTSIATTQVRGRTTAGVMDRTGMGQL